MPRPIRTTSSIFLPSLIVLVSATSTFGTSANDGVVALKGRLRPPAVTEDCLPCINNIPPHMIIPPPYESYER
eukprot:scaffold2109_cov236-Chaetoceros_neogracile.AAC.1